MVSKRKLQTQMEFEFKKKCNCHCSSDKTRDSCEIISKVFLFFPLCVCFIAVCFHCTQLA